MKAFCVVGPSDTGKTSLVERLMPLLAERGKVGTVKSIHHDVQVDEEGKDTHRHREAGAERVVGVTPETRFEFSDVDDKYEEITAALDRLADAGYDYAVVEGFADSSLPKLATGETDAQNVVLHDADEADDETLLDTVEGLEDRETLGSLVRRVKETDESPKAGAVSTFTGRVRAENVDEARTTPSSTRSTRTSQTSAWMI